MTDLHGENETSTLPSPQSNMLRSGRLARCIDVVHSHTGKPSRMTTAQKDRITSPLVCTLFELSGGGCFRAVVGLEASLKLASSGSVAIPSAIVRVYYPGNDAMKSQISWVEKGVSSALQNLQMQRRNLWPNMVNSCSIHQPAFATHPINNDIGFCITRGYLRQVQGFKALNQSRKQ